MTSTLRITDLNKQPSTHSFQCVQSHAPFQDGTLIQSHPDAHHQSPFQQYSSSIPIATSASPRRKAFNPNEDKAQSSDRPSSYLPVPRGLTPLSMNFVIKAKGSSSSGSMSSRPGFPTVPSSDLIHASQEGYAVSREEGPEVVTSPFEGEIKGSTQQAPRRQRIVSGGTLPQSASATWDQSKSSHSPGSTKLNFSYPTSVRQAPIVTHTHSRSAGHNKIDSTNNALQHLRNRSNGTIITYASSAFTSNSTATTKIQPVIFNDSPRSSFSNDHYQPNGRYVAGSVPGRPKATSTRPRTQSTSRLASESMTLCDPNSSPETLQNYKFPTSISSSPEIAEKQGDSSALSAPPTSDNNRRSTRRASGKLPDMLFSRAPSGEGPTEPASPISLDEEDMDTIEDASVLDPMDYLARRQSSHLYANLRLSATSLVASSGDGNETLKETQDVDRPPLGQAKMSTTSLMISTSSAASTSFYGMAV